MKQYQIMKDSGIEWIGKIPEHWKIANLKSISDEIYRYPTYYNIPYVDDGIAEVRGEMINDDGTIDRTDIRYISPETAKQFPRTTLQKEDFVISVRGTMGKVAIIDEFFHGANITANLMRISLDRKKIKPKFMRFFFLSYLFNEMLNVLSPQTTIKTIKSNDLASIPVCYPNESGEQKAIAEFLDKETSKIDSQIKANQKLIELLKEKRQSAINSAVTKGLDPTVPLKDSGIEGIGEIPEYWKIFQLRYLMKEGNDGIKIGPFGSSIKLENMVDNGFKVYGQENVLRDDFEFGLKYIDEKKFSELKVYEIIPDDVVVTMMGSGTPGRAKVVPTNAQKGIMDSHLVRLRTKHSICFSEFLADLINYTSYIRTQVELGYRGSTMTGLNSTILKSFIICLPPLQEQKIIKNFLNKKISEFIMTVSKINAQVEKLQEYRQSLISSAVTGKIDVRKKIVAN